jgi:hypothetical protein
MVTNLGSDNLGEDVTTARNPTLLASVLTGTVRSGATWRAAKYVPMDWDQAQVKTEAAGMLMLEPRSRAGRSAARRKQA